MEMVRSQLSFYINTIRSVIASPYTCIIMYLLVIGAPFIALVLCYQSFGHYESAQESLEHMLGRLSALESFDLRDLKKSDRLMHLSQIPLQGSDPQSVLKLVSESSVESPKIRETTFSMVSNANLDVAALMRLLDTLQPPDSKIPPKDLLVRTFKLQNEKSMNVQISLIKREPKS